MMQAQNDGVPSNHEYIYIYIRTKFNGHYFSARACLSPTNKVAGIRMENILDDQWGMRHAYLTINKTFPHACASGLCIFLFRNLAVRCHHVRRPYLCNNTEAKRIFSYHTPPRGIEYTRS